VEKRSLTSRKSERLSTSTSPSHTNEMDPIYPISTAFGFREELQTLRQAMLEIRSGKFPDRCFNEDGELHLHVHEWQQLTVENCPNLFQFFKTMLPAPSVPGLQSMKI